MVSAAHFITVEAADKEVGIVQFLEEKVRHEAAMMRYVAAHTTIPVPLVYQYATAVENLTGLGPFIIMEHIDHGETLSHALNDPRRKIGENYILDPDISDDKPTSFTAIWSTSSCSSPP